MRKIKAASALWHDVQQIGKIPSKLVYVGLAEARPNDHQSAGS